MALRTYEAFLTLYMVGEGFFDGKVHIVVTQDEVTQDVATILFDSPVIESVVVNVVTNTIAAHMYDLNKDADLYKRAVNILKSSMPVSHLQNNDFILFELTVWGENKVLPPPPPKPGGKQIAVIWDGVETLMEKLAREAQYNMGGTLPFRRLNP